MRKLSFPPPMIFVLLSAFMISPVWADLILSGPTITPSGGVTCDGTCEVFLSGSGIPADPYKLTGGGTFVSNGTPGSITATVSGSIGLEPDEQFYAAWDFSTELSGGTAEWYLIGTVDVLGLGSYPFETDPKTVPTGLDNHVDSFGFTNPLGFTIPTSTFEASVIFNWSGADGDTFTLTIPDNSIDMDVRIVPEPTTLSLFVLGALSLFRRRNRS